MSLILQRAAQSFERFRSDTSGNIAIIFALSAVVLMLAIGAGVDVGRWLHARDQTVAAIDAAVLAGGRSLQTNGSDRASAIAAAEKYYVENVTSRLPVIKDTVSFTVADDGMGIVANGSAFIKTPFLQFADIKELPLFGQGQNEVARSQIAIGGKGEGKSIEVALMLDVTGSMQGSKLSALKDALIGATRDCNDAANALICIIFTSSKNNNVRVSVVPFSEDIRLPSTSLNAARGTGLAASKTLGSGNNKATYHLTPCVVERRGAQKYTDVAPAANRYVMAHYNDTTNCALPSTGQLMPLTNDKTALMNKIKNLTAAGVTAGHLGTAWAWYTLSPNWNTLWPATNQAAAYGTGGLKKYAILMTDGEYNTAYDTNGVKVGSKGAGTAANGTSTDQARALCTAMKTQGIIVYTVGFDVGETGTAVDTLKQCATDPTKYYNADNNEQLKLAYQDIALKLSSLYISK
jgi:Flp pilus assembly protein TadG